MTNAPAGIASNAAMGSSNVRQMRSRVIRLPASSLVLDRRDRICLCVAACIAPPKVAVGRPRVGQRGDKDKGFQANPGWRLGYP